MDDDVMRHITLIELSMSYSVYKIHTDRDAENNEEFKVKVMDFLDTLNVFLDEFNIKPHEMQMFVNCHFIVRTKKVECEEAKKYPKQCQKCLNYIDYNCRFKPCSGLSCLSFN